MNYLKHILLKQPQNNNNNQTKSIYNFCGIHA